MGASGALRRLLAAGNRLAFSSAKRPDRFVQLEAVNVSATGARSRVRLDGVGWRACASNLARTGADRRGGRIHPRGRRAELVLAMAATAWPSLRLSRCESSTSARRARSNELLPVTQRTAPVAPMDFSGTQSETKME